MKTNPILNSILDRNLHNALYFKMIMEEQNLSADKTVIILASSDDSQGIKLARLVLPGFKWDKYKEKGGEPLAMGLASREKVRMIIRKFSPKAFRELERVNEVPVVVVSNKAAEIFSI